MTVVGKGNVEESVKGLALGHGIATETEDVVAIDSEVIVIIDLHVTIFRADKTEDAEGDARLPPPAVGPVAKMRWRN